MTSIPKEQTEFLEKSVEELSQAHWDQIRKLRFYDMVFQQAKYAVGRETIFQLEFLPEAW